MPATIPAIIELETRSAKEVVDITARVEALLDGAKGGSCLLYLRHTTAGLMVVTSRDRRPRGHHGHPSDHDAGAGVPA